jgi:hypothetical protein
VRLTPTTPLERFMTCRTRVKAKTNDAAEFPAEHTNVSRRAFQVTVTSRDKRYRRVSSRPAVASRRSSGVALADHVDQHDRFSGRFLAASC